MLLVAVSSCFLLLFLALHVLVIPRLERAVRADLEATVARRAARLYVAYVGRTMAATAMVATGLAVAAMVGLMLLPHDDAAASAAWITRLATLRQKLSTISPLAFAALAMATTTLLVLVVRATTRRRVAQLFEDQMKDALEALAHTRGTSAWVELPPTPDMAAVDQAIEETLHFIERTHASHAPAAVRTMRLSELERRHEELLAARERLDVKRRVASAVDIGRLVAPEHTHALMFLVLPWLRPGPLSRITRLRRWTLTVGVLLAYAGTVGALVPVVSGVIDERLVAIDEKAIIAAELRSLSLTATNRDTLAPLDEREEAHLRTLLARSFESAFGAFLVEQGETHVSRSVMRERLLLDFAAARRRDNTVRALATLEEAAESPERAAIDWVIHRVDAGEPVTTLGRRFAQESIELGRRHPAVLRRLRTVLDEQEASLEERPPITALRMLLASEAVGAALAGGELDPKNPSTPVARELARAVGVEALEPLYNLKSRQFNSAVAETNSLEVASMRVARTPLERMRRPLYRTLLPTLEQLPTIDPGRPPASLAPPALREEPSPDVDPFRAGGVLETIRAQLGYGDAPTYAWRLATPLAEYDDWVPAQKGSQLGTLRGKVLSEWSAVVEDPTLFARSRNHQRLAGAARGAGLVLGLPPLTGKFEPDLHDLSWVPQLGLLELVVVDAEERKISLGVFPRSMIASALAYAADNRPLALAVSTGAPLAGRRAILHPALVDTAVGCRIHALVDRLDAFGRNTTVDENADRFVQLTSAYAYAWALRARHIDAVARLDGTTADYPAWVRSEAEQRLIDPVLRAAVDRALAKPDTLKADDKSPLRKLATYFDPWLVEVLEECAGSADRSQLDACISAGVRRWVERRTQGADVVWWQLPPDFDVGLYATDGPYSLDPELSAIRMPAPDDFAALVARLDVDYAATITTPPVRTLKPAPKPGSKKPRTVEDQDAAFGHATWQLPGLGERTERALLRTIAENPQRLALLESVVQFIVLQRFFRLALDGELGPRFPLERLLALSRLTARAPASSVRTARWYDEAGQLEKRFAATLVSAERELEAVHHSSARPPWVGEARRAFLACARDISVRAEARENLSEVPDAAWAELCTFAEPPALGKGAWAPSEAIVRAVARQASVTRELRRLRRALGVHKDDARGDGSQCPAS